MAFDCFVLVSLALIGYFWYLCEFHALVPVFGATAPGVMHQLAYNSLFAVMLVAYCRACANAPGAVPPEWTPDESDPSMEYNRDSEGKPRVCARCESYKPPRTHHCSECGVCVLRMDHHCPWIGGCVGFYNHKYFVLFLFYLTLCGVYTIVMLAYSIYHALRGNSGTSEASATRVGGIIIRSVSTLIAVSITLAVGSLLSYQVYLVSQNKTNIDDLEYSWNASDVFDNRSEPYPYDQGSRFANMSEIMGRDLRLWLLPILPRDYGDGLRYDINPAFMGSTTSV